MAASYGETASSGEGGFLGEAASCGEAVKYSERESYGKEARRQLDGSCAVAQHQYSLKANTASIVTLSTNIRLAISLPTILKYADLGPILWLVLLCWLGT